MLYSHVMGKPQSESFVGERAQLSSPDHAVLLSNGAASFEGARSHYSESSELLVIVSIILW